MLLSGVDGRCVPVNRVLLAGRLTRDPETRELASGKRVTTFVVITEEYAGSGRVKVYSKIVISDLRRRTAAEVPGVSSRQQLDRRGVDLGSPLPGATVVIPLAGLERAFDRDP